MLMYQMCEQFLSIKNKENESPQMKNRWLDLSRASQRGEVWGFGQVYL